MLPSIVRQIFRLSGLSDQICITTGLGFRWSFITAMISYDLSLVLTDPELIHMLQGAPLLATLLPFWRQL